MFRALSASSVALALITFASAAAAGEDEDKRVCLSTYVDAQAARQEGKLLASQRALVQCGRALCPDVIRNDCVRWMREVSDAMPSVVLSAKGPDGRDRVDARVILDGRALPGALDGRPLSVDPGEHVFRFEIDGAGATDERVVVRQGEKDRPVVGVFPRAPLTTLPATTRRPIPASVWVLGGVGTVSLVVSATFAGLGWFGKPGWSSSQSCRPNCPPDDVSTVKTHFVVADIAGGVALASLGAAAFLFFTRAEERGEPAVSLTVAPRAAGVAYRVAF